LNFYKSFFVLFLVSYLVNFDSICHAQKSDMMIDSVTINGHKKTKNEFLKRFIYSETGSQYNPETAIADVFRLRNLSGIVNADYAIDSVDNVSILKFDITERITAVPVINLGGLSNNFWFRVGFTDFNFRGKGEIFNVIYQNNDRRHTGQLYFARPYIGRSSYGYSLSFSRWASIEPLFFTDATVNFDYTNTSLAGSIIKNFKPTRQLEVGTSVFVEDYQKSENQFVESPPGPEGLTQYKVLFKYELRDQNIKYFFHLQEGIQWSTLTQHVYNFFDNTLFNSIQLNLHGYKIVNKLDNVAMRFRFGVSTNSDSPFAPFVADSHVNLRGVGNRIDRGTAQLILNLEYRKSFFNKPKWAGQLVAFSDIGTWRNPGGTLGDLFN